MVMQGPTDEVVIILKKSGDQSAQISPLLNALLHGNGGLQNFSGVGGFDFYLWMDDSGIQFIRCRYRNDVQRIIASDQSKAAVDGRGNIVGMGHIAGQFFPLHGKLDQFKLGKGSVQEFVHGPDGSCGTGGTATNATARFYPFINLNFKTTV